MTKKKNDRLFIGIILVLLTKVLDWSNLFMLVGLVIVFDALFSVDKSHPEDSNDTHHLD